MKYTLLYILSLCLLVTGCTRELSEVPESTNSGDWLPALTRADVGTKATIAGFSSETATNAAFSKDVVCTDKEKNIWEWQPASVSPSLNGIALLTASIPPIDMSKATIPLNQSELSRYPKGLQLGYTPAKINAVNAIKVYHRLAQLDLDCEGTYFLNDNIDLYLASVAEVDFRTATIKTASGKKAYTLPLENRSSIVLTILPQTFKQGEVLFQYQYDDTKYTYRLERDLVVSNNQRLKVRISPGEEDKEPIPGGGGSGGGEPDPPPTVEISVTTSTITEWITGSESEVPVGR
ncbi:MAG: hypothetical protein LUF01_00885 [Bacteroides sp.]|nr:hypothetical protein [Bacteroides sp.]